MADFSNVPWVRQTRTKYNTMLGLYMVEIERTGQRWTTTLISIITGQIIVLETRSPLSVAIRQAENRAAVHTETHLEKEEPQCSSPATES